ncbi:hypothetical protein SME13J_03700 [Serratia marcescens]|nr:hypothetical protein SME13J_03700 [Serratia marcescens]
MDNKLSELSKPVAWEVQGILCHSEEEARVYVGEPERLYSQEYVSALLVEMERYKQYAKERDAENESLALTAGRLRVELEAKDNRITELEAKTAMTMGVGSGNGNLFVHGDYDSIKAAQAIVLENESLRAKLATPVRLPEKYNMKMAGDKSTKSMFYGHNSAINDSAKAIRAAGFTVSEE